MAIIFGPSGLGSVKESVSNLKEFSKLDIKACEIAFTYGVYIKDEKDINVIREASEKYNIKLSIHAQYWLNLNSHDPKKIEASKKRIIDCLKTGEKLGCYAVVIHPGYYGKMEKEETYQNIKSAILNLQNEIKINKWKIKLCIETMGKTNVFGSIDDIKKLVKETGCSFCLDFAHLKARSNGNMTYKEMVSEFSEFREWHCHFSGIVYGEKGEKHHIKTPKKELVELLEALKPLKKSHDITIINESPDPVKDSILSLKIWKEMDSKT
ncbi:MAG: TIM barrel protein [Candidatus Pacearchaeota archaeon]